MEGLCTQVKMFDKDALIEGGFTRKGRRIPPMEKPIICVDTTSIHWSVS